MRNRSSNNLNPHRVPNVAKYRGLAARDGTWARMVNSTNFNAPEGCWEWTSTVNEGGYGVYGHHEYGRVLAHRLALHVAGRPVPVDMTVDHLCHDPEACAGGDTCPHRRCVNPAHLAIVTKRDNVMRGNGYYAKAARAKAARDTKAA